MTSVIPLDDGIWWIGVNSKLYYQVSIRREKSFVGINYYWTFTIVVPNGYYEVPTGH